MNDQSIFDVKALVAAVEQGYRPKFVFFWHEDPRHPGRVGEECLSQWYPAAFEIDGITYPTAEHYMMCEKARLFGDMEAWEKIRQAPHPKVAKSLGRGVRNFDPAVWSQRCFDIVVRGNTAKFGQNPALREYLVLTKERVLVEASPFDDIWGIHLSADDPRAGDPRQWQGTNLLGFALMKVRAGLGA
jgi:ribA/ribD-fused uncharacterized protein